MSEYGEFVDQYIDARVRFRNAKTFGEVLRAGDDINRTLAEITRRRDAGLSKGDHDADAKFLEWVLEPGKP